MNKKVLVTGANGQLGYDMIKVFNSKEFDVVGFGKSELNVANQDLVNEIIYNVKPDIVIHCAAYTNVDQAETEPNKAFLVNAIGARNIAVATERFGAKLVYISTDYVFDGQKKEPYHEFDQPCPINIYGKSKLAGEQYVRDFHSRYFIVRTSWVYGKNGNNFVKTMLKLAKEKKALKVVNDQKGCPTYTVDLANVILELVRSEKYGIYHVTNSGSCTWYEFANTIFEHANINVNVEACTTKDFPRPAMRPANSILDHLSLRLNGYKEVRHWKDALQDFLFTVKSEV
ncbi:dTDP-4-dehydrorhamnose reductase [Caldalkalibacillus uzonensis]|uniref:dTDP-4-dehydrorhamnose reductase n=1 Tax=Caldalkalibacillus uzonensis TaxID=353224 RepID=A0ABU0CSQ9_9BACI|nr:dTDP-4-dehydrorhamnose reductase [Caldalkalibacillus uzonensis]MDQ0339459.1 dTDP-4-dehydrorhamnose reductase [Caldalkalibacillus uzonensis]